MIVVMIPLIAVIADSGIGQAIARRIEGGAPDSARLRALEEEVGQLNAEVRRIQEQSEFLTRLLENRSGERDAGTPSIGGRPEGDARDG